MGRNKTLSRILFEDARKYFKRYDNNVTRRAYVANYRKFINYCRSIHRCKSKEECGEHISEYVTHLIQKGLSPSTIHSYLAPLCIYHGITLGAVTKPKRRTSEYTRGRSFNGKQKRNDNDLSNPKYDRLVQFQKRVGIRRQELARLRGGDFGIDPNTGEPCVFVRRGKGGRYQAQHLLPGDAEFIKNYFNNVPLDKPIFSKEELKNQLPLHFLRARQAQTAYYYYLEKTKDPVERSKLIKQVKRTWEKTNINKKTKKPKRFDDKLITGTYFLRGANKKFAQANNLPIKYDNLALTCVSFWHLAHFRNTVTVANYMLVK